jgi:hypothetical protein
VPTTFLEIPNYLQTRVKCAKCRAEVNLLRGSAIDRGLTGTTLADVVHHRELADGRQTLRLRIHQCKARDLAKVREQVASAAVSGGRSRSSSTLPGPGRDGH